MTGHTSGRKNPRPQSRSLLLGVNAPNNIRALPLRNAISSPGAAVSRFWGPTAEIPENDLARRQIGFPGDFFLPPFVYPPSTNPSLDNFPNCPNLTLSRRLQNRCHDGWPEQRKSHTYENGCIAVPVSRRNSPLVSRRGRNRLASYLVSRSGSRSTRQRRSHVRAAR